VNRSGNCTVEEAGTTRPCTFEEREGLHFQMFDPATGSVTRLARTTVSRGLHGTATLLPDGSVFFAGENREALVRPDDPSFPLASSYAGLLPRGDPDQGVPVGQLFFPPYLFDEDGSRAARPVIKQSPEAISYGGHFDITVAGDPRRIASLVLLRSDHNTHSLTTGDRYVKLAFRQKGAAVNGELRVRAPKLPAQAVPGVYMLFVVDGAGIPSTAKRLYLESE
jgi:galactose oxidase